MNSIRDLIGTPTESEHELDPSFGSRVEVYPLRVTLPSSLDTGGLTPQIPTQKNGKQLKLSFDRLILKDQLASRILKEDPTNREGLAISCCHTEPTHVICRGCNKPSVWWNRCERRYCPLCAPRLARERQRQVEWWYRQVRRPRMLTLTVRNSPILSVDYINSIKKSWNSLRRSKLFEGVEGGFWSIEVTNQGNGWHVHIHAVLDSNFIAQDEISKAWAKRIGQEMSIVDIRELRGPKAMQEVLKYVSKPSEMIHWNSNNLLQFLSISKKLRLFGVWGNCYKQRTQWKEFVEAIRSESGNCECGCSSWKILDHEKIQPKYIPPPRPPPHPQISLGLDHRRDQAIQAMRR